MPYIKRDSAGKITALFKAPEPGCEEFLPLYSSEVASFLGDPSQDQLMMQGLDIELVRVLEDLVDTLIQKNILRITDLPDHAQRKLMARKGVRTKLNNSLSLLGGSDGLI